MVSLASLLPQDQLQPPRENLPQHHTATNVGRLERTISILAGGLLMSAGLKRLSLPGTAVAALGFHLIRRGATGHCAMYHALNVTTEDEDRKTFSHPLHQHIRVHKVVTVAKPVEEVFAFWRKLENLPRFMDHLESVTVTGDKTSHWVARAPRQQQVQWDAEITDEKPNEHIAWRSTEGADVPNAGEVRFKTLSENRGTEVHVLISYDPPAGIFGAIFARLFGEEPSQQVHEDLRRFKNLMEAGEIPTIENQPQGNCR
jgi:uncharacterized membrane protein